MKKLDPILVSVIANRYDAICSEIGETMYRTSRSPIFSEARDFVTAIFDRDGPNVSPKTLHCGSGWGHTVCDEKNY